MCFLFPTTVLTCGYQYIKPVCNEDNMQIYVSLQENKSQEYFLNSFNTFIIKNKGFLYSWNVSGFFWFLWLYCIVIFFLSVTPWTRFRWRFGNDATRAFEVPPRCCETARRWFFTFTRRVETSFEKTSITAHCSGGVPVLVRAVWLHHHSRGGTVLTELWQGPDLGRAQRQGSHWSELSLAGRRLGVCG